MINIDLLVAIVILAAGLHYLYYRLYGDCSRDEE